MSQPLIRNAPLKPPRGEKLLAHRAKTKKNRQGEKDAKLQSKRRDSFFCRWPNCVCRREHWPIESAHLTHKGAGGDPKLIRTTRDSLITLCQQKHRGAVSLDSGDLDIRPRTTAGTDGPCEFFVKDVRGWELVAKESAVHVLEIL